jgi:hypothetical protein
MVENQLRRCSSCCYSRSTQVIDPVIASRLLSEYSDLAENFLPSTRTITKCHLQGKPQVVDGDNDWCYQWRSND